MKTSRFSDRDRNISQGRSESVAGLGMHQLKVTGRACTDPEIWISWFVTCLSDVPKKTGISLSQCYGALIRASYVFAIRQRFELNPVVLQRDVESCRSSVKIHGLFAGVCGTNEAVLQRTWHGH
jgi:hypothetical protein